jgi:hypothetical protein
MGLLPVQQQLSKETPLSQHTEPRRQQAIDPYLAADKVEDIGRQLACSKSWLYKWRHRDDAHHPAWAQERSKRPKSHPTHTPQPIAQAVVSLHLTLHHHGTNGGVGALIQARAQQGVAPVPSRRTLYRILRRHHTEVQSHGAHASRCCFPVVPGFLLRQKWSTLDVGCSSPEPDPHWKACHVSPVV